MDSSGLHNNKQLRYDVQENGEELADASAHYEHVPAGVTVGEMISQVKRNAHRVEQASQGKPQPRQPRKIGKRPAKCIAQ
jgi:hypothetical protein